VLDPDACIAIGYSLSAVTAKFTLPLFVPHGRARLCSYVLQKCEVDKGVNICYSNRYLCAYVML